MGYAQWVVVSVFNFTSYNIKISNVKLHWGKWHRNGDKSSEIVSENEEHQPFEGKQIKIGETFAMYSCGRENSPSGTTGEFDLLDAYHHHICHIYWDCPWGSTTNTFTITGKSHNYDVTTWGENLDCGALGEIHVRVRPRIPY